MRNPSSQPQANHPTAQMPVNVEERKLGGAPRAVFATLAEAVSIKEWFDVIVGLPEEYHGLFPPRLA